jgi:hypothetical protein
MIIALAVTLRRISVRIELDGHMTGLLGHYRPEGGRSETID